MPPVMIFWYL